LIVGTLGFGLGCTEAQPTSPNSTDTRPGSVEGVFDVLERPGTVRSTSVSTGVSARGEMAALYDGDPATGVTFDLPPGAGNATVSFLEVELSASAAVNEISIEIDPAMSQGNYTALLSRGSILDDADRPFRTMEDMTNADPKAKRVAYLRPIEDSATDKPVTRLIVKVSQPASQAVSVRITELSAYERPTPGPLGDGMTQIFDVHFHPCAFSNLCTSVDTISKEQERYGLGGAFLFGLQHNLMRGLSPWAKAVSETYDVTKMPLPFHYNDPGARPSDADGAVPPLDQVNERRETLGLTPVSGYEGWLVYPTTLADWQTISMHAKSPDTIKQSLFPFVSSLRLEKTDSDGALLYGVCTTNPKTSRSWNEDLLRAFDTLFPGSVYGYAEYNLNKVVMFSHGSFAPLVDDEWLGCMKPAMDYIAKSARPIGFHVDLAADNRDKDAFESLMQVAKSFPDTIMIWHHGGISPEVAKTLSAREHIEKMQEFISSSPGKRYVELSWGRGFFLRLNPSQLGDEEVEGGVTKPRDYGADFAAYMSFLNENADVVLFGSDQVGLHFPIAVSQDLDDMLFVNHVNYTQGQTYGSALREEIGLLTRATKDAEGGSALKPATVAKIFAGNAQTLTENKTQAMPGMTQVEARAVFLELFTMQHQENVNLAGPTAPAAKDFIPAELMP
jgi:hypothetical protein